MGQVTVKESYSLGYLTKEVTYTDEELFELFGDSDDTVVCVLLKRAQAAENRVVELENTLNSFLGNKERII